MHTVIIRGYSDDIIALDGAVAIEINEPGLYSDPAGGLLEFGDADAGTVLRVRFTPAGTWAVTIERAGPAHCEVTDAVGPDDDAYSDCATLTGDLRWVRVTLTTGEPIAFPIPASGPDGP
jgi:hypothetical protein